MKINRKRSTIGKRDQQLNLMKNSYLRFNSQLKKRKNFKKKLKSYRVEKMLITLNLKIKNKNLTMKMIHL